MKILKSTLIATTLLMGISCKTSNNHKAQETGLRDAYKNSFHVGTALNRDDILQTDSLRSALIGKEFSSITAENIMKSMFMHPEKDVYQFDMSDKYVEFGEKNNMFIHGHTLIWHSQLAPWMRSISDSTEMAQAMESHIKTIVEKYKGRINSWDVVNEALNEDGTLRNSAFYKTIGSEYLAMAFKWAAETDPNTDLYYNDYNLTNKAKRAGAVKLVKDIQSKGIKIDGVGMQGHWHIDSPSIEEIEESILDYANLGVKVAITELDVSVLPNPWNLVGAEISQNFENNKKLNPYPEALPDSMQVKLAKRYSDIFKVFLKHQDKISRVTFWGTSDKESWLNDFPVRGRTNYPLLFDRELKPKAAYDSILALKK
ncbi:endo-1,4-beta-xylanase [Aestuariibaculum suncheonense]|uniref:Beta-xylanase n=1 Tax=Aestuariibaculum suncheonense TaxID=1028745 RepID=A0A8J6UB43_9FLAO|nr:endo-1,4-beta-xylanase [Aestuariibaculum suncheonense]MBD0835097.1 endo-1,4-beta-xylanase [Aestuariibaculum suncheonense]